MTKAEAVTHFKTQQGVADALGIAQSTVAEWGIYPPPLRQLQLQQVTKGKLKAEPGLLSVKAA